jgi:hypothetical protein
MKKNEARLKTIEKKAFPVGDGLPPIPPTLKVRLLGPGNDKGEIIEIDFSKKEVGKK